MHNLPIYKCWPLYLFKHSGKLYLELRPPFLRAFHSVGEITFIYVKLHPHLILFKKEFEATQGGGTQGGVVSFRSQILEQFWEVVREVIKCRLITCCFSELGGPCPQAWIFCGFHPLNLEQFHWTLSLASVFRLQIDNGVKWSLSQWASAQNSKAILREPLAMN